MRDSTQARERRSATPSQRGSFGTRQARRQYPAERMVNLLRPRPSIQLPNIKVPFEETQRTNALVYLQSLRGDLYRKTKRRDLRTLVKMLFKDAGFKHIFWFRTATFARNHRLKRLLYPLVNLIYRHYQHKHGVWLTPATKVGAGLFLEHMGDIVVNGRAVIGKNCNLANGVTIGQTNRGKRKGAPTLGDNVFIGPGAKILGNVTVGNNVAIGANCLVVEDVPDNAVIAAHPGQIISYGGVSGYINNTDYDEA